MFAPRYGLTKMIYEALIKESQNRKFYNTVDEWIINERNLAFNIANEYCKKRNFKEITIEDVMKAESCVYGHVDYMNKFSQGITRIILDKNEIDIQI